MPPKKFTNKRASSPSSVFLEQEEGPPKQALPTDLVEKILKNFFEDNGTKISIAAKDTVGEYIRTFVREAICRATAERREGDLEDTSGGSVMLEASFSTSRGEDNKN